MNAMQIIILHDANITYLACDSLRRTCVIHSYYHTFFRTRVLDNIIGLLS